MGSTTRDKRLQQEIEDVVKGMKLLGAETPGSIECEECGEELVNLAEVDVTDVRGIKALFVAHCHKCNWASSQPCHTEATKAVMRARVVDAGKHGISEEQIAPRKFLKAE